MMMTPSSSSDPITAIQSFSSRQVCSYSSAQQLDSFDLSLCHFKMYCDNITFCSDPDLMINKKQFKTCGKLACFFYVSNI